MEFKMEELKEVLEEMGFKDVPPNHLELFAKDLKRLMKHERHVQKKKAAMATVSTSSVPNLTCNSTASPHHLKDQQAVGKTTDEPEKSSALSRSRKQTDEAAWKRLKTDPVRLYGWYKTFWELHGLNKK